MLNYLFGTKPPTPPPPLEPTPPLYGYLMKMGQHHKTWKERWFVMQNGHLAYYKSKEMDVPIADIALHDAYCRLSREYYPQRFCFEVVTPTRVYQLIAKTQEIMAMWMDQLSKNSLVTRDNEAIVRMEEMISQAELQSAYMMQHSLPPRALSPSPFMDLVIVENPKKLSGT
eukprot:TRINITY_DN4958_c0_g1_i1.p1 TRINITY_DN4958_c0_g1~~TRINITY_DN4958_c0_g1_i1.p1  ORF type:complete len:171 (-),score=29.18 TRINITY_DN4958_c0_g1_i1:169-681(-)